MRRNPLALWGVQRPVKHLLLAVLFAFGLAGCFGGASQPGTVKTGASPASAGRLQIAVRLMPKACPFGALGTRCRGATPTVHRFILTCDPAGGTVPNPPAACRAIGDYLTRRDQIRGCIGTLGGPGSTAAISGTYAHRPFHLKIESGYSWCGQPPALLRDYWVISTFPCSTLVLRTGGSYPAWPRATGCTIDSV